MKLLFSLFFTLVLGCLLLLPHRAHAMVNEATVVTMDQKESVVLMCVDQDNDDQCDESTED